MMQSRSQQYLSPLLRPSLSHHKLPEVCGVTEKVLVEETSIAVTGSASYRSLVVISTSGCKAAVTIFHQLSVQFTVTLNDAPVVLVEGIPVFPSGVPATAVSPGRRSCNFEAIFIFTVTAGLAEAE